MRQRNGRCPTLKSVGRCWRITVGLFVVGLAGCGTGIDTDPEPSVVLDGNRDDTVTSPLGKTFGEPNGDFFQAIIAVFDAERVARLQGTVAEYGDLDVFCLGALWPGDRVIVDATSGSSPLDVSVAIFDAEGRIVANNDDRTSYPVLDLDAYIDWITRHGGDRYYLAVTHSAFGGSGHFTGTYRVDVELSSTGTVPPPVEQILMLDFDGGAVDSPALGTEILAPFDAGAISPIYQGQTEVLKEAIRATVEQNYARFNVTVMTTDDLPPGPDVLYSTIFFGGYDPMAFGIAESVDSYNMDCCDDAIIYTQSFEPSIFSVPPSVEELGVAIGNIASHEAGHLLGLNHVDDDWALMDDRSAADAFLEDQEFIEAPLSADIMPLGTQDAVLLLIETVGLAVF